MPFHRESLCLQGVHTLHVFPCYAIFKKDTLPHSLLLSPLYTTHLYLSLCKYFLTNPPRAHVTSIFTSCPCTPQYKPIPSRKKTNIPTKIIVVRNPLWFRLWYPSHGICSSTPCTSLQFVFSMELKNKKRFHGVFRKIYGVRGVYWLSTYRICMVNKIDSGGWLWVFFPVFFSLCEKKKFPWRGNNVVLEKEG